jgi:hypothetical protein
MVHGVRGPVIGTIALAGLGLFGTGVAGLAQVDSKLADSVDRPAVRDVRDVPGAKGDCPYREQQPQPSRSYQRRQL